MMSDNVDKIKTMLTEEKWTRSTIANYTITSFQDLDTFLASVDKDDEHEIKQICDEHLAHTKNSIMALYISGALSIARHPLDDSSLLQLVELFEENKKWNIVEFLCQKILAGNESRYALRALAECYFATGRENDKYAVWERLVKVDYEEVDVVKAIAEWYEAKEDMDEALFYYKRAMLRYINAKDFTSIQNLWAKFLGMIGDEFGYLMGLVDRVASKLGEEKAIVLLTDLYDTCGKNIDRRITVLKRILDLDQHNIQARETLVDCYREKYKDHSRLAACIDKSGLTQSYRDVHTAVEVFEKNIAFDKGTFVYHKSWGIGRIREIGNEKVVIDFASKRGHEMSMEMAFNSLQVLPKTHIWVLKSAVPHDKLANKIKNDIPWALRTLISSNGDSASFKAMKAEMVPSILTATEWTQWTPLARKELMSNPLFDISSTDADTFTVRTTPISYEEKQLNIFKAEKNFYEKIRLLREFISSKGDLESDSFIEMVRYFNDQLASLDKSGDITISSYMLINDLRTGKYHLSFIQPSRDVTFADLYYKLTDKVAAFKAIKDSELNKAFIDGVVEADPENWQNVLLKLFPHYLTSYIPETFREQGKGKIVLQILKDSADGYKEDPEMFLYLVRAYGQKQWDKAGVPYEKLLLTELQLLDYTFRCIENGKAVSENRKYSKLLMTMLFDEKAVMKYINAGDETAAGKVYSLIEDMVGLDMGQKIEVKHQISEKFPGLFKEEERVDRNSLIPTGLLCTQISLDAKKKELVHIMNVELPEVAKEIGTAREMGDLRENSEYKYGKEKQGLLNTQMRKLSEELDRAQVITPDMVDSSKISFGTNVLLRNNLDDTDITYRIMGPWESDPSNNVISFLAPLGTKLLNHGVGDTVKFEINEQQYDFTVKAIEALTW
jgi:transcription elongation factor GreA